MSAENNQRKSLAQIHQESIANIPNPVERRIAEIVRQAGLDLTVKQAEMRKKLSRHNTTGRRVNIKL